MSSFNCCFLTFIQISQKAGQVVWYSSLLKNFLQFVVIHTVKGFGIVNEAEVYLFLKFSCFLYDPMDTSNLISGSSDFSVCPTSRAVGVGEGRWDRGKMVQRTQSAWAGVPPPRHQASCPPFYHWTDMTTKVQRSSHVSWKTHFVKCELNFFNSVHVGWGVPESAAFITFAAAGYSQAW